MTVILFIAFIGALTRTWLAWTKESQRRWRIASFFLALALTGSIVMVLPS